MGWGRFRNQFFIGGFWQSCKEHFFTYRRLYIVMFICGLAGFVSGLAGAAVYTRRVTIIEISDGYIMGMINGTLNGGSIFWSRLLSALGIFALIILFGLHRYMRPCYFVLIIFRSFLAGFKIMLLIGIYGITGVFSAVVFVLPFEAVFFVSISYCSVCAIDRCAIYGRSGVPFRGSDGITRLLIQIWPAAAAILIFSVIEAIFVPIFIGTI